MNLRDPIVSVVIPFFNGEEFLVEAVDSVFAQTLGEWELLLVDDGSTDRSPEMARAYQADHPDRIRYVQHPQGENRGASASRNLGSHESRGEFVAFLDADDVWLPHKLEQQVAALRRHPDAGWTYGRGIWWYSWTGNPDDQHDRVFELGLPTDTPIDHPQLLVAYLEDEGTVPSSFAIMARREALDRTGGGSEENWRSVYDDQVAFANLAVDSPVVLQDDTQYLYRQHGRSRCAVSIEAGEYFDIRLEFLMWLRALLDRRGSDDPGLGQSLALQFELTHLALDGPHAEVPGLISELRAPLPAPWVHDRVRQVAEHGVISTGLAPGEYLDTLFARLPTGRASCDLRDDIYRELMVQRVERRKATGDVKGARRDAWTLLADSPRYALHQPTKWVIAEQLIGAKAVGRIRARRAARRRSTQPQVAPASTTPSRSPS